MGRGRSWIYKNKHFKEDSQKLLKQCEYCTATYGKTSTEVLIRHLKHEHGINETTRPRQSHLNQVLRRLDLPESTSTGSSANAVIVEPAEVVDIPPPPPLPERSSQSKQLKE